MTTCFRWVGFGFMQLQERSTERGNLSGMLKFLTALTRPPRACQPLLTWQVR